MGLDFYWTEKVFSPMLCRENAPLFLFFFEKYNLFFFFLKMNILPWLVCLSWLEYHPSTEESRVQSPVRVHAWVMGLVSSRDAYDRQLIDVSLALAFLSLSLSPFLSLRNQWMYPRRTSEPSCHQWLQHPGACVMDGRPAFSGSCYNAA